MLQKQHLFFHYFLISGQLICTDIFRDSGAFITKREIWPSGTVYGQLDEAGANMNYREEYELEIDLRDLFFYILYQWRTILLAALILCAAGGAYALGHNVVSQPREALTVNEQQMLENEQSDESITDEEKIPEKVQELSVVKYAVLGFFLGAFGIVFLYGITYILNDKIRGDRELRERYGYYLLGTVPKVQKKRFLSGIDSFFQKLEDGTGQAAEEEAYGIISANIRNLASENSTILVTGTVESGKLKTLIDRIMTQIEGVVFVEGADMNVTASTLERLATCDAVILVEERDVSRRARIHREQESIAALKKTVVGYVML
nr:hypothetical protein [uncultured Acetatifactor sp.]